MKQTLMPWERGVRFDRGSLVGELGPGEHKLPRHALLHRVDLRTRSLTPAAQDVPTSDGVLVRVTVVVRWAVTSPTDFVCASATPVDELYVAVQLALRGAVLTRAHSEVDAARAEIGAEVLASVGSRAAELGVEVSDVAVRDGRRLRGACRAGAGARGDRRAAVVAQRRPAGRGASGAAAAPGVADGRDRGGGPHRLVKVPLSDLSGSCGTVVVCGSW